MRVNHLFSEKPQPICSFRLPLINLLPRQLVPPEQPVLDLADQLVGFLRGQDIVNHDVQACVGDGYWEVFHHSPLAIAAFASMTVIPM